MTIFLLDLSKKGFPALGSVVECTNLLMLDLSNNALLVINGIETLTNLKHLNLSYNKLTQLDPLKTLNGLERLDAQGNMIKDTRTLEILGAGCTGLKVIYLQEFNKSGQNPVCATQGYRKKVLEVMPSLKALDGYRVAAPVMDPGQIEDNEADGLEYQCDEEWYNPDIYLTTAINKDKFQKTA